MTAPILNPIRNLYIAVLGATIWDILIYIPDDIRILRRQRSIRAVNICFVTSRLFSLCYVFLSCFAKSSPLDNCDPMFIAIGCCCILSVSSSSFLFLRRVQAVWAGNRWISRISFVLWVFDWGSELVIPTGVRAVHIPSTRYCIDSQLQPYVLASVIFPVIFDTFVFLAISYKIIIMHSNLDANVSWNTVISGKALPRLSRAILQGGQQYYLINLTVYILLLILLVLPSTPPILKNMFAFPSVSISASMACRVHRNIKLFDLSGNASQFPMSTLRFSPGHSSGYDQNSTTTQSMAHQSRSKDPPPFIALNPISTSKPQDAFIR